MTTYTVPSLLAEYAEQRGYGAVPRLHTVFTHGRWHVPVRCGDVMTPELVLALAESGLERVAVQYDGPVADFTLHELLPWTGIAGNPASFPTEVSE